MKEEKVARTMDPNPTNYPILSFVMSKFSSMSPRQRPHEEEFDIEQPPPPSPPKPQDPNFELYERMPRLADPKVVSSMRLAVADVSQARKALHVMGERPDHKSVDIAKVKVAELNTYMDKMSVSLSNPSLHDAVKAAEKERKMYKSVVDFDEMLAVYEGLLKEAEARLEKIYEAAVMGKDIADVQVEKGKTVEEEFNPEVEKIMKGFEAGKGGESVDLSDRKLRMLPETFFASLKSIVSLNLSTNCLQVVPISIGGFEKLEELNLSSNELESLPDCLGLLINLKILDVSKNKLVELPESICHCRSLVELNASFNQLGYLPTNIGYELLNLRKLSVQLNKIRSLPTSVGEMKSLHLLDAHFNELRGLPISIGKLLNLEVLNLGSNFSDLSELPHTIGDLINLKELDLSNNQIHELPDTLGMLKNLIKLNLDHNPLIIPPTEVVAKGVEAIKGYMSQRRVDLLMEEDRKRKEEEEKNENYLTRNTSKLSSLASNVSRTLSGYLGSPRSTGNPSYLDQEH